MERSNAITVHRNGTLVPAQRSQALPVVAMPVADVIETEAEFMIRLDLPGASRESIRVVVERGMLAVSADLRDTSAVPDHAVHREIFWNRFERRFNLGMGIDEEGITAETQHGVLTVHVPKSDAIRARDIPVR